MKIGLVGKANVGKSTFFQAATSADTERANYPFATIEPNRGVAFASVDCVEDEFDVSCDPNEGFCRDGTRYVPVELIDVAGLVPGAHEGRGLGNQFLSDLNEADVLIHVVDASGQTNAEGEPTTDPHNPVRDVEFLEDELDHWYRDILADDWDKLLRRVNAEDLEPADVLHEQMSGVGVTRKMAETVTGEMERSLRDWTSEAMLRVARRLRELSKPMVIAANKADTTEADAFMPELDQLDYTVIPTSAESEIALREADSDNIIDYAPGNDSFTVTGEPSGEQKQALGFVESFLEKHRGTGVQACIDTAVFDVLGYKAVFPGGVDNLQDKDGNTLPDCFLLQGDAKVLDFAYFLHSDIGDNFIKAIDIKTGMPIGKDHVLDHRDVVKIEADT